MKTKFLKLEKPCQENWDNMKPNASGNFCELCSKTVIDFTRLNPYEISEKMKQNNEKMCARVTKKQLNMTLLDFENQKEYKMPYSNIAAGLIIASTIATTQNLQAQQEARVPKEMVQTDDSIISKQFDIELVESIKKTENIVIFKGIVVSETDVKPINHAKITFFTLNNYYSTYSKEDGTFSLEIPTDVVDNDNVIRVSYYDVVYIESQEKNYFDEDDYIITKEELNAKYKVSAKEKILYFGRVSSSSFEERIPIAIKKGVEMNYKKFLKELYSNGNYSKNENHFYFEPKFAIALYGRKAKYGLHIIY